MTGQQLIAASREQVWAALNDPDILRQCIPGCQSLEKESSERMKAVVGIKIGPIGARFTGVVTLSDLDPPNGYTIAGEGQGGTVGFAKGGAKVGLATEGAGTMLTYEVDAQVGGRLAQLGGPIIDATAKQLAGTFFDKFSNVVGAPAKANASPVTSQVAPSRTVAPAMAQGFPTAWILALVVATLVGFLIGRAREGAAGSDWMGLSIGLLVVIVAAVGFAFGRRAAAPIVMLDAASLARLADWAPP